MTSAADPADPADRITLAHGNGGRRMRELVDGLFRPLLGGNDGDAGPDTEVDAAPLPQRAPDGHAWCVTTDGFTVEPLEFPGGNIGSLAIHGTVNDLAVAGAQPVAITVSAFIEEGLERAVLERIVRAAGAAARASGVRVVAGDTKVVRRGQGGGLYLCTTGLGLRPDALALGLGRIRPGDAIVASGTIGDHGAAVLLAREQFGLSGTLASDAASVLPVTHVLLRLDGLRFMRDPTRGGVATVAHDVAAAAQATVRLDATAIPVRPAVASVCEILGFDPLYLASEGRVVAVLAADAAPAAVAALRDAGHGDAAIVGRIEPGPARVVLRTALGGERLITELEDDPLPRIC